MNLDASQRHAIAAARAVRYTQHATTGAVRQAQRTACPHFAHSPVRCPTVQTYRTTRAASHTASDHMMRSSALACMVTPSPL